MKSITIINSRRRQDIKPTDGNINMRIDDTQAMFNDIVKVTEVAEVAKVPEVFKVPEDAKVLKMQKMCVILGALAV